MINIVINIYFLKGRPITMNINDIINLTSDFTIFKPFGDIPYG